MHDPSELQHAYVLHRRPYRETSLLLDVLTEKLGRVSVISRGGRRKYAAVLQPFNPLIVSCAGRGELLTLKQVEAVKSPWPLQGDALMSGFYLNELLMRVLHRFDPCPVIYEAYETTLAALAQEALPLATLLRCFEKTLLTALGYAFNFKVDPALDYYFFPDTGFQVAATAKQPHAFCYSGAVLKAIEADDYAQVATAQAAKRLFRHALQPLLGQKPLNSRSLMKQARHRVAAGQGRAVRAVIATE